MPKDVFSLLGMLAIVVLVLILAYWATRWIGAYGARASGTGFRTLAGGAGRFRILAQLSLGRAERLVLARVGDRCYLLGVTANRITLLRELEGEEAAAWLSEESADVPPGFLDIMKENLRKRK